MQVKLDDAVVARLENIAMKQGCDVKDCAKQAVREYLDVWEDHLRSMDLISQEEQIVLSA